MKNLIDNEAVQFGLERTSYTHTSDTAKLNCLSCEVEHVIIRKKPAVVLLSDQNFESTFGCDNERCINKVRVENASL